tara:strand:+ start:362 stop:508 length:147 start_codon:yes stop_codon:yes gene_type:complete
MKNKIVEAKKKKKINNKKGTLYAMGAGAGNRVAGKIITPKGEKDKIPY